MEFIITEKVFNYKDFKCVITFNTISLHRCGYVAVPYYEYHNINFLAKYFNCHGGISYVERYLYNQQDSNVWWIGFDCRQSPNDGIDLEKAKTIYNEQELNEILAKLPPNYNHQTEYTIDVVEEELKSIVDQILGINKSTE